MNWSCWIGNCFAFEPARSPCYTRGFRIEPPAPMSSSPLLEIVCAHSPDSDDAFMFYGLATKKVRSKIVSFRHVLEDIESLNRKATEGLCEITAISYHAYPYVADKYVLMASGSSVGDGYGPIVVSSRRLAPEQLKGKRVAIRRSSPAWSQTFSSGSGEPRQPER